MYEPSRLEQVMQAQGRRWDWLAAQTDYAPATVSRYLNGIEPISDKFAIRAARALGIPVDWLRVEQSEQVPA